MSNKINTWKLFVNYINEKEIGSTITRKEVLKNINHRSHWTIDNYRLILTHIGCLKTEKPGKYKIVMKVPDLPLSIIRDLAFVSLGGIPVGTI